MPRDVCDMYLVPFIREKFPDLHLLHMDNAPSHSAASSTAYLLDRGIFHFKTPAQSPDLNPIELVWNDLKSYIKERVKPKTAQELLDGIFQFWNTVVTVEYCNSKIDHVKNTVLDEIIKLNGIATGL